MHDHDHHSHHQGASSNAMAASATLHCLTGCAAGEIVGLVIGTAVGLSTGLTIVLAVSLAFLFGYTLSTFPILRAGASVGKAVRVVFAADTLSIATMELVDNVVMALVPGAMGAGLVSWVFWLTMPFAFAVAFAAAFPVNKILLQKGAGHALVHPYHGADAVAEGWRARVPNIATQTLLWSLIAFVSGGLLVSVAATFTSSH